MIACRYASGIMSNLGYQKNNGDVSILQVGLNRASNIKLCSTTDDPSKDLKLSENV